MGSKENIKKKFMGLMAGWIEIGGSEWWWVFATSLMWIFATSLNWFQVYIKIV
jgi:hypothetical protein